MNCFIYQNEFGFEFGSYIKIPLGERSSKMFNDFQLLDQGFVILEESLCICANRKGEGALDPILVIWIRHDRGRPPEELENFENQTENRTGKES